MAREETEGEPGLEGTVRERLRAILLEGPASARDLSKRAHVSERDVSDHLEHLRRSLRHLGESLEMEPPHCLECGFGFAGRRRTRRPGRCPRCHGRRITLPRFRIERSRPTKEDGSP